MKKPTAKKTASPRKSPRKPATKGAASARAASNSPSEASTPDPILSVEQAATAAGKPESWNLRLYVAGQTPKSIQAFANLKRLCEQHLPGRYKIEVIDLVENPQLAAGDQILAVPTLVRKLPSPLKRIIGNLSDEEKFLVGLDLKSSR